MRKLLISTLIAVTALAACTRPVTHGRDTIPLVKEIAAESTGAEHKLLASFSKVPSSGDIYIIGSSEACALAGRAFRRSDVFENARGSLKPDGLRDFAGENFACICDSYFAHTVIIMHPTVARSCAKQQSVLLSPPWLRAAT